MSKFGGRKDRQTRSEADRERDRQERERRRLEARREVPDPIDPLLAAPAEVPAGFSPASSDVAPAASLPTGAATPPPPAELAPETSWWDVDEVHDSPAPTSAWPPPMTAAPAVPVSERQARAEEALLIEPDPPAQPLAPAGTLPDHRKIAIHHRRRPFGRRNARTVVSPPGDADMGGRLTRTTSRRQRILGIAFLLFVALLLLSQWELWQPFKGGGSGQVIVTIPAGASASDVSKRLAAAGVIDSATLFNLRAALAGKRDALSAGRLVLKKDMSYGAALGALSGGTIATADVTSVVIPEGLSIKEISARLKGQDLVSDYAAAARRQARLHYRELRRKYNMPRGAPLEGFLFPSTYQVPVNFAADDLIDRQLQAFQANFDSLNLTRAKRDRLSPYDVLTIASMVEREARVSKDRPLISAVIYNRLRAGMPLGIDATTRYATGNWTKPLLVSELAKDGPYNTRTRTGLPASPIGNPGLASLQAAAHPARVNYLYFVVKPGTCGQHVFSSTAAQFAIDSAKYNAARKAAGGSPETC